MMMGRDESMPNRASDPDLSSEERDAARAHAKRHIEAHPPPFTVSRECPICNMARAVLRYVPAGVPAPVPHEVASADDQTRPADLSFAEVRHMGLTPNPPPAPYTGSPALDFITPAGVICEPLEEEDSSGVCEVSDDSSTSQNKLNLTGYIDLNDGTKR